MSEALLMAAISFVAAVIKEEPLFAQLLEEMLHPSGAPQPPIAPQVEQDMAADVEALKEPIK